MPPGPGSPRHPHPTTRLRGAVQVFRRQHPRADEGPAASTAERRAAIAGIAAAIGEETEATIAPLLRIAATATSAALRSAAPEEAEDHYDLRRWRRWSIKWDG